MLLRISDPRLPDDLVRFLRRHDYLAVKKERDTIEAVPINTVSERADRKRLRRDLSQWRAEHPGIEVEILESR
jgi:hypothetical protein